MLVSEREAARHLGVTVRTLRNARATGRGPEFYRLNAKLVRYDLAALDNFLAAARVRPQHSTTA